MALPIIEQLKEQGWYLSSHGYNLVSDSENILDIQKIIKHSLDFDLREIGSGQGDIHQGNIVLQIQKIRNVAVPKNNEEYRGAPRTLKISLTDGKNNFQGVEVEHISSLSLNTPPGSKILLKPGVVPMSHGMILLRPSLINLLGGKVSNLVEKWELNKKLAHHTRQRSSEEGGPPPWIPFGKKIVKLSEPDKNFKALVDKEKPNKENTEFETQRKDAIAEASKQGSKKVFGGGNKQLLDHSVQKIVDQGFSIEQAEYALKVNKNNVDKALKSLQRTNTKHKESREPREPRGKRFDKKSEESKPSSGKISLFDFLEDKLPMQPEPVETKSTTQNNYTQNNDNNYERLESRNQDAHGKRGGRSQRGGRGHQASSKHAEENKISKKLNTVIPQSSQYNGANSTQQTKPPRFQRNQDTNSYYQQDNGIRDSYHKSVQPSNYKTSFVQSYAATGYNDASGSENYHKYSQDLQGKNSSSNRNHNHLQSDSRTKLDASYGRHNRAHQDGTSETYTANTSHKNYKNQLNRYQPNSTSNKEAIGSTSRQNEDYYDNNQSANIPNSWAWQVGDKCMAKYWEDNRYYNAEVTGVSERTCVVQFKGFENYEEVLQIDCIPITEDIPIEKNVQGCEDTKRQNQRTSNRQPRYDQDQSHITAGMEFRRGGNGAGPGAKGYTKKRGPLRSSQPIYQPPAQRNQYSMASNSQNSSQL